MDVSDLNATEEVKQLKARYFRAVDEKDWHTLRGLFTDDARAWYPGLTRWFTGRLASPPPEPPPALRQT